MEFYLNRTSSLLLIALSLFGSGTTAWATPKVVKVERGHYSGTWLEIGRTPMFLTNGCVAGYSTYLQANRQMRSPSRTAAGSKRPRVA